MPLLVLVLVVAVVLGLVAAPRTALLSTAVVAAGVLGAYVWAVADGKGDDPAWLLVLPVVVGAAALWLTSRLAQRRSAAPA